MKYTAYLAFSLVQTLSSVFLYYFMKYTAYLAFSGIICIWTKS